MADLEEAILLHHESLSFRPTPHPERFISLYSLACMLRVWDRFGKTLTQSSSLPPSPSRT